MWVLFVLYITIVFWYLYLFNGSIHINMFTITGQNRLQAFTYQNRLYFINVILNNASLPQGIPI